MKTPGRLSLLRKALFSLITCCLFFGLLETLLWAVGIRQLRDVRDPFVGFTPGAPLFTRSGDQFETTDVRRTYFNLQTFAAVKPAGTRRIFCLGGSTTYGHPWDDSTSYPRWLRDMLNAASPDQRWEVVNCGGISYASYRLAWLTDELLQYQPDVLIVHTGHNEFLEDRSWSSFRELSPAVRSFAALAGRLRTTTLLDQVLGGASREKPGKPVLREEVDPLLDRSAGPSVYSRDDDRARMVVQHLEHSLQKICRIGRAAGIPVILVLPGSNLRDFAPFRSDFSQPGFANSLKVTQLLRQADELQQQQQPEQAFSTLQQAVSVDPRYAAPVDWRQTSAAVRTPLNCSNRPAMKTSVRSARRSRFWMRSCRSVSRSRCRWLILPAFWTSTPCRNAVALCPVMKAFWTTCTQRSTCTAILRLPLGSSCSS